MSYLITPRMSEKTYGMSTTGVFVFDVDADMNKHQIAELVEKTYEVNVESVRIVIQNGKKKRLYRKRRYETGVRSDVKKAYVTLKAGQSIPIFAAVEEPDTEEKSDKKTKKSKKEEK